MRRYDKREKRGLQAALVVGVLFLFGAVGATWETFVERPAAYQTLQTSGVLANARVHCSRDNCTLTYVYAGRTHKNSYDHDRRQFGPSPFAEVLIDPKQPETMYTVYDVQRNSDTGFGVFGIFCLVGMAAAAGFTFMVSRAVRRYVPVTDLRPEPSASAPASAREAAMPGLEPEVRSIPAELTNRVRSAKRTPLIGGVRLDPQPLFDELRRVWHRVAVIALR